MSAVVPAGRSGAGGVESRGWGELQCTPCGGWRAGGQQGVHHVFSSLYNKRHL